jgi:TolB-like protein
MKILYVCIIPLILTFAGCAGNAKPAYSNDMTLDQAIREASNEIIEQIPAGSNIAVLNFNSPTVNFSDYVLDELITHLVRTRTLTVVDRKEIDLIRGEFDFQYSGYVSDDSMQALGRMLGAQVIVSGSLQDIGGTYRITIRVLNVQNATVEVQYREDIVNDRRVQALLTGSQSNRTTSTSTQIAQTTTTPTPTYRIGDVGPAGGIIFYDKGIFSDGWRYLEAAPASTDREPFAFPAISALAAITDRTLGAGLANTRRYLEILRMNNITGNTAPWICDTLVYNGFNDWYLPSLDELLMMYTNLRNNRNAGFLSMKYWSSTCFPVNNTAQRNPGAAYFVDFSNGNALGGAFWGETLRVRAIRRF